MERLDKLVADRAMVTRTGAKALIRAGRVLVNGIPASRPEQKAAPQDQIMVDSRSLDTQGRLYLMLNKPAGVLSATEDREAQTVLDILPEEFRRKGLFPAGRLDKDTEGFVLITDDGKLAHRILSPKRHVPKTYLACLNEPGDDAVVRAFGAGMDLGRGDRASPARLVLLEENQVQVTIYEGVYHQVKRMFEKCGRRVTHLKRIQIGGLSLDESLPAGGCRKISPEELELLEKGAAGWHNVP